LACFAVVVLHYPTAELGMHMDIIQEIFGRCGVPVFLMISGLFAGQKLNSKTQNVLGQKSEKTKKGEIWFLKQAANMIKYFLIFSVIIYLFYLAFDALMQKNSPSIKIDFSGENIKNLLLWNQPFYSGMLWYLLAYAYCLVVYWLASFFGKDGYGYRIIAIISPSLVILSYVFGRYSVMFFGEPLPHYYSNNFIFSAIPMFTIGFNLPKMKIKSLTGENTAILLTLSMFLLFGECMTFAKQPEFNPERNNYIFNLAVSFLIMYYISHNPKIKVSENNYMAVIGRKYSLYIYAFQGISNALLVLISEYLKPFKVGFFFVKAYNVGKPFAVFFTSLLIALLYTSIVGLIKKPFGKDKRGHNQKEQSNKVEVLA
jgi:protein-S-isoprenylcysteine O-methyltransferase Ste14